MFQRALLTTICIAVACLAFPQTLIAQRATQNDAPIIRLSYGAFRGNLSGNIAQFLGMPFAAPP